MINVSVLKEACAQLEKEFGSDAKVCIQLREDDGRLISADYVNFLSVDAEGNLYLSNRRKFGE